MVILICAGALWGKSELTRVKPKALKIASREKTSRSLVAAAFSLNLTAKIFAFAKRFA